MLLFAYKLIISTRIFKILPFFYQVIILLFRHMRVYTGEKTSSCYNWCYTYVTSKMVCKVSQRCVRLTEIILYFSKLLSLGKIINQLKSKFARKYYQFEKIYWASIVMTCYLYVYKIK